jgi:hypothetical protein
VTRNVPHDPALPGLRALLPEHSAPGFVAESVDETDPSAASVAYVRWWPLKDCTLLWAFPGKLVSGVLFAGGRGERLVAREAYRRYAAAETYRYLPDRRLLLEQFPLDRRLRGLPFAACARRVGEALGVELIEAVPVSYKPWRRCVLRYRGEREYFGKVFRHDRGAAMVERLAAVARGAPWVVPVPAAYVPDARLLLFEGVGGGREIGSLVRAGADLRAYMEGAALGLARFRRLPTSGVPVRTAETVLRQLEHDRCTLAPVVPELAAVAGARLRALAREALELPPERLGLAHGAFRHNQLLVRGEELVVLDLDGLCLAGAGLDPGTFLAGLDQAGVHRPARRELFAACAEDFAGELDVHPGWVSWHRGAARLHLALREAFALAPLWRERADALLNHVPSPSLV